MTSCLRLCVHAPVKRAAIDFCLLISFTTSHNNTYVLRNFRATGLCCPLHLSEHDTSTHSRLATTRSIPCNTVHPTPAVQCSSFCARRDRHQQATS